MKAKLPYIELEFTKSGLIHKPSKIDEAIQWISDEKFSDVIIFSHGWNNDKKEARVLYKEMISFLADALPQTPAGRRFGVLGILWPSKRFTDNELKPGEPVAASLKNVSEKQKLLDRLKELEEFFDAPEASEILENAQKAARTLDPRNTKAVNDYVKLMKQLIDDNGARGYEPEDAAVVRLEEQSPKPLLVRLGGVKDDGEFVTSVAPGSNQSGTRGGAAALPVREVIGGAKILYRGARNLLNFVTYYQMKKRAGLVGELGLKPVLEKIKHSHPSLRLHLMGHSFGARLVSFATARLESATVNTLILLQAAFSHHGFAEDYSDEKDGVLRPVLKNKKVTGPILISHTHNDLAVGKAYAIASRIARQTGEFIGGPNDLYGGLGANGAQKTPEAVNAFKLDVASDYAFEDRVVYNLNADSCIAGHSEICNAEVARAISKAILKS